MAGQRVDRLIPMATDAPVQSDTYDWTAPVADRIESVVDTVRDKTTVPATQVARGIVYGIVVLVLALVILVLVIIGLMRVLYVYLPIHPLARRIWVADAIVSAIFLGAGALVWRLRRPREV
jgi:hypothetical protein